MSSGKLVSGEGHPCAKLTDVLVLKARAERRDGATWDELTARYGVTKSVIWKAVNGMTWRHLNEPEEAW